MVFNIFTTKLFFCFGQYDRIDDLIPFKLRGDKRSLFSSSFEYTSWRFP